MKTYMNFIKDCWNQFMKNGYIDSNVRKEIADSWMRCREYNVNPMNGRGVVKDDQFTVKKIQENIELISIAKPIMKGLYEIVKGSEFAIILTDKDGYVLETIGDNSMLKRMKELNFVKGALWNEEVVGTNAIGTAIYLDKPIQTIGAEHYCIEQHSWTCSGAPIHNEEGEVIGCINMSGNYYNAHPHTLGIVTSAAQSIQKQLAVAVSSNLMNITFNSISEGIIVLNKNMKIKKVNGRAAQILNSNIDKLINTDIKDIVKDIDFEAIISGKYKSFNSIERNFCVKRDEIQIDDKIYKENIKNINKKVIPCILDIIPMKVHEKVIGIVITFTETGQIHKLVNKVIGYKAKYTFDDIITQNQSMKKMIERAKKIALNDCNILIEGESGTGKELIAQSIHNYSKRKTGPFVAINCASIPRELVESEFFGYEKGAFTGASKEGYTGKFELANGGTIFLDEIGELPLDVQSKLLRVLDNNKITRVGGNYEKQLNVRVIGATNRKLKEEIKQKNFRADVYYRLSVMNIKTIPLNDRKDDIEILVNYFINILDMKNNRKSEKVSKSYIKKLLSHSWGGNVRELRNVIERDYYLNDIDELLESVKDEKENSDKQIEKIGINSMDMVESEAIKNALKECNGNKVKACRLLNIGRSTLYRKIKKYNINEY
ncbi:sigma-54-dependent Fis family transcriptional regulator [Clostridium novyi]|uniref:Aco operon expression regulatory protein n=1 Tax=Clostridium novyi (strain NT) TaxID=386415 RepID=A0Q2I8_CLONN|nr:sigma-54-dependent Fis family transcriptional regulator [Clostridium novyi]ABK62406.1 aco operon expression regulatory protein [Clostridium novyi NT]KEH86388.1 ATPase AAA [Clostridium novyi A str. NCTC 538]KEH91970.1 ATPase AAA [Clostridium novyi A str. GD211209]